MRNSFLLRTLAALALPAIGLSACSENDEPGNNGQTTATSDGKFVIAATVTDSKGTTNLLLTAESLDEGHIELGLSLIHI